MPFVDLLSAVNWTAVVLVGVSLWIYVSFVVRRFPSEVTRGANVPNTLFRRGVSRSAVDLVAALVVSAAFALGFRLDAVDSVGRAASRGFLMLLVPIGAAVVLASRARTSRPSPWTYILAFAGMLASALVLYFLQR